MFPTVAPFWALGVLSLRSSSVRARSSGEFPKDHVLISRMGLGVSSFSRSPCTEIQNA